MKQENEIIRLTSTSINPNGNNTFNHLLKYFSGSEGGLMLSFLLALILLSTLLGKRKNQITSGRFVSRLDRLNATGLALKQINQKKSQPCTLWSGTPSYWFGQCKGISAYLQTAIGSPPTVWFPNAERGVLVIGAPGSGKTFSVIDRAIESAFAQGFSVIIYDKKGDQMKLHAPLAARYGYEVEVFAPGEPYSGVINPLDFVRDAQDSTMAGEIGRIIMQNAGRGNGKGDEFFQSSGEQLAKGLVQLAKASPYPDLAMVYALIQLPLFVKRLEHAVYRNDDRKLDYWIAASFSNLLSSKDAEKTVAGIKATAELTYSSFIQKDLLRAFIGKSTIPLKLDRKQLIIFKLDDRRRSVVAPLLATAIHLCVVSNLSQKREVPFVYSLDEFPSLKLDRIVNWVNEYRSNGGCPIIGIQSLNQLYDTYGDKQGAAIASALSTHVLFNPGDYDTAEKYSKRYGETEVMLRNRSTGTSSGVQTSRSVNWSEQIHKKPLISADEIMRFPQGKCVITSPAYGNGQEAAFPYRLTIPVIKADRKKATDSEALWHSHICPQLIERASLHQKIEDAEESDFITTELEKRIKAAYEMLPLPDEVKQVNSNVGGEKTSSESIFQFPEVRKILQKYREEGSKASD
jgi:type IV secretion system protein VirD4